MIKTIAAWRTSAAATLFAPLAGNVWSSIAVVGGAEQAMVTFDDGTRFPANTFDEIIRLAAQHCFL